MQQRKRRKKKKLGTPARDTSPGGEELNPTTKEQADQGQALNYRFFENAQDFSKTPAAPRDATPRI
jgi:hypothetical protein